MCNLASIALNRYVRPDKTYDFGKLVEVTKVIVRNLNKIIDVNYYPVPEVGASKNSIFLDSRDVKCRTYGLSQAKLRSAITSFVPDPMSSI